MSNFHPLVSIVIPVYNGANYMCEAIDSALAQTYDNCEVLVINDGSDDEGETDRIARSYGDKIRYFAKENGGVASALNLGIKKMHGEYFSWLSHDDVYQKDKVSEQIRALGNSEDKYSVVYSDHCYITHDGSFIADHHILPHASKDMFSYLYERGEIHGCTLLIPRKLFLESGMFPEHLRTTQDYELWFQLAKRYQFLPVAKILVKSRIHNEQGSALIPEHALEVQELYDRHLPDYIKLKRNLIGDDFRAFKHLLRCRIMQGRKLEAQRLVSSFVLFSLFARWELKARYVWWSAAEPVFSLLRSFRNILFRTKSNKRLKGKE